MYYVYDGRVFDDRDDLNDYRDDNPGGTTQRFNTKAEANAFLGGMLTGSKPAPTKQPAPTQTGPVGTPSSPPKQMPGESGPFDPNAPVPTPAPAPIPTPPSVGSPVTVNPNGMLGFTGSVGGELGDNFNEIPTYRNPDGSINLESLLQYLRSRSSDLEEIMAAGTPGEYELTIGGPDRDSPLAQVYASIIGRANEVPPEVLADETGRQVFINEEFGRVFREIAEAGSWEAWVEANEIDIEGPPEEPPTDIEEEEPEAPEQQTISLEDFQEIYSSNPEDDNYLDPAEYMEDGTYTDPETGIVYVINIPPPVETEEEEGGGGAEAPTDAEGEPTTDQPAEEEVIVDPSDSTVDDEDAETAETIPPDTTETGEEDSSEIDPGFEDDRNYYDPNTEYQVGDIVNDVFGREWVYLPDPTRPGRDRWVITNPDDELIREYEQATGRTYEEDMNGVAVYGDPTGSLEDDPNYVFDTEEGEEEDSGLEVPTREPDIIFDPTRTPDFPGGPAPIPEQEPEQPTEPTTPAEPTTPTEPTEPTTSTEPVPPAEEVPETPTEPTPPAEEPEQPTEETEPTPPTEQPTEQPTPTEEAPETPEQPGTETPSDTPTTGTDETGTAGEGEGDGTGTGTGTGTGEGEGEGGGTGTGERRDGLFDDYQEFMTSIGYQPVQLQQLIAPPKKDYFRELDNLIGRSLFGKMI